MRRAVIDLAAAAALGVGAIGCGEAKRDYAEEAWKKSVPPKRLRGATAMSAEAGRALGVTTGSSRFVATSSAVAEAAQELGDRFTSSVTGRGDICWIYPLGGTLGDSSGARGVSEGASLSGHGRMIRRCIPWRNRHAGDRRPSALVGRADVA